VNIQISCSACEKAERLQAPLPAEWRCPPCGHVLHLKEASDPALSECLVCGGAELYKKKDFPHALGMAILTLACLASTITYFYYQAWWTWSILIGSAAFDGLLYLWVKDVIVCYRCNAHYRGVVPNPEHKPFELTIHERYRQEEMRRKQLAPSQAVRRRS
jgi:hypothetical protein